MLWRTARARATAESETAEGLAREALEMAKETDYPDLEARALMALAEVVGPGTEASRLLDEARGLYEKKGNVAAMARLAAGSPQPS